MTENKLLNEFLDINKKPLDERGYFYDFDVAYESVEIAEEFVIGFVEWICKNDYNLKYFYKKNKTKELLEIYKKEQDGN